MTRRHVWPGLILLGAVACTGTIDGRGTPGWNAVEGDDPHLLYECAVAKVGCLDHADGDALAACVRAITCPGEWP